MVRVCPLCWPLVVWMSTVMVTPCVLHAGSNTDWSVRGNPVDTVIVKQAATKLDVPDTANVFLVCVDGSTSMTARVLQSAEGVIR